MVWICYVCRKENEDIDRVCRKCGIGRQVVPGEGDDEDSDDPFVKALDALGLKYDPEDYK